MVFEENWIREIIRAAQEEMGVNKGYLVRKKGWDE
jgi:hypothetical protein